MKTKQRFMKPLRFLPVLLIIFFAGLGSVLAQEIDYGLTITGVEDKKIQDSLRDNSLLVSLLENKPSSIAALRRRARSDTENFKNILREFGYFSPQVSFDLKEKKDAADVIVKIEPGQRYSFSDFIINWSDSRPDIESLKSIVKPSGKTVQPQTVLSYEQEILNVLMQHGYPFPEVKERRLIVNHDKKTVTAQLTFIKGPKRYFGKTSLQENKRVEEEFIRRRIDWDEGDIFDIRKVARTRRNLIRSGVIASADIRYSENGRQQMPVGIVIDESKHRSIGAGAAYSSSQGEILQAFWEHRNLFGQAEKFRVRAEYGRQTYALTADFNKPEMFGNTSIGWLASAQLRYDELEAFDRSLALISSSLSYQYSPEIGFTGGFSLEQSRIEEDSGEDNTFTVLGLPFTAKYDNSDNLLNPRRGLRINLGLTPYMAVGDKANFFKTDIGATYYLPLGEKFVWANRARTGALLGASRSDIPADKRFYAGGGGSVRGYGHQLIGPLDRDNNPTGGRMLIELGTEARFMVSENIEIAGFYEGARVTRNLEASSDENFRWGAGAGARYHTAIGPVRVDVAVPLDKRDLDDNYQFYISLGQAF
jgi:translocation and assembly module TamA